MIVCDPAFVYGVVAQWLYRSQEFGFESYVAVFVPSTLLQLTQLYE